MQSSRLTALAAVLAATLVPHAAFAQTKGDPTKRDLSKGNTLYVVPYAHLDTQWRWAYPQVIREFIWATMADNLSLIDKYPNYVFNFSGSRRYEMMKEYYPEEYAKVAAAIKQGRWFPCGSSVDEGDANVPSAESLVRHVLYGNDYFRKNFGIASQEFMLPDCFGFPYALPTVLKHCGLTGFSTQKLTWGSSVGIPFKVGTWEGPDGASIIAALDPGAYTGEVREDLSQNTSWLARIQNTGRQSGAYVDYHYYGTGDRGGAPGENSVSWVEKSIAGKGPISVVSARADAMFLSLTQPQVQNLPHYKGELLLTEHSAGSITSQAHMKRWNRKNELLADAAERASVTAMLLGRPYPQQRLYTAWDLVLGSQMHDMLPGTSLPRAYEFCYNDELLALNQFASIAQDSVGTVASQLDTRAKGTPIVVYNPLDVAREDVVEALIPANASGQALVMGPNGAYVPTQVLGREGDKLRIAFLAKVAPNSFSSFDAIPRTVKMESRVHAFNNKIENERFVVTISPAGEIASIYDKVNKRETLKAPTHLDFQHHNPSQFPAWNMDWEDQSKAPYDQVHGPAKIRVIENGPVRATIEVERWTGGSKFVQRFRLAAGQAGDRVEVENHIDWQTHETALKAAFPLANPNSKATYDLQVGAIERGNNEPKKYEVPQHQWFDVTGTDGKYGVAILNDSKFGSDKPSDDTIRLTLLYTPGVRGGYQDQAYQDFGRHTILYAIAPHVGDWRQGDVAWKAKRMNQPLRAFVVPAHNGALGKQISIASTSTGQVDIQAIKRAEDGDGIIVRLRELTGKPANLNVSFLGGVVSASEVDGQERPVGPAQVSNGRLVASVKGYSLKAYRVHLGRWSVQAPAAKSVPVPLGYDLDVASTDKNDRDGAFDAQGRSYSADLLPKTLDVNEVNFRLGSTADGAKNALSARGQTIKLPAGYSRVYLLASATQDVNAQFKVGNKSTTSLVPAWNGFVGQWDTRLWVGAQPELSYGWDNPFGGLVPGYEKKAQVAWYGSHLHIPGKGNGQYEYTYLFLKAFDVPKGATTLTLPNDPRVRVFAVSVANSTLDSATPAAPLYDTLDDHQDVGAPKINVPTTGLNDATTVTVEPPLYWQVDGLRYTLDGSKPTASSPLYKEGIVINRPVTISVANIYPNGQSGPVAVANVAVHDTTSPRLARTSVVRNLGVATLTFSERVDKASAETASNYTLSNGSPVESAVLEPDGRTVNLTTGNAISGDASLRVQNVKDMAGNAASIATQMEDVTAVYTLPNATSANPVNNLEAPIAREGNQPWTLNLWAKMDKPIDERTLVAGFGRANDGRAGNGRYFAEIDGGITFWIANQDVMTKTPYEVGKWQMLTATYDGTTVSVYKNGQLIGKGMQTLANDSNRVNVFPLDAWDHQRRASGSVRDFSIWGEALSPTAVARLYAKSPK